MRTPAVMGSSQCLTEDPGFEGEATRWSRHAGAANTPFNS